MAQRPTLLAATGQRWKLAVALTALVVGSIAPVWPDVTGIGWIAGSVIAVAGYAYGCLGIRCPACGSRWFWEAALDAGLYGPLFRGSACPACKRDFAPPEAGGG